MREGMRLLDWLWLVCGSVRPGHVLHEGKGRKRHDKKTAEGMGLCVGYAKG